MSAKWVVYRTLLFVTLLCAAAGSASVSFRGRRRLSSWDHPVFVAQGDFNADGKSDLVMVNVGDPNAKDPEVSASLLGNGDGTFQAAMNFSAGNNPTSVAVGQ